MARTQKSVRIRKNVSRSVPRLLKSSMIFTTVGGTSGVLEIPFLVPISDQISERCQNFWKGTRDRCVPNVLESYMNYINVWRNVTRRIDSTAGADFTAKLSEQCLISGKRRPEKCTPRVLKLYMNVITVWKTTKTPTDPKRIGCGPCSDCSNKKH
jgi:hypothetical protein